MRSFIVGLVALAGVALAPSTSEAAVFVARARLRVVAPVVAVRQVVAVQRVVAVRQVVVAPVVASIVHPVQAFSVGHYGVQSVVAPAGYYSGVSPEGLNQLAIERERTKQEQLRTEQLRLQLSAPK